MEGFMTMEDNIRMHYQMLMRDEVQKATEVGIAEGSAAERLRLSALTERLEGDGRLGELPAAWAAPVRFCEANMPIAATMKPLLAMGERVW